MAKREIPVGSPNSIARYIANTDFGENGFATFAYHEGMPHVVAAGTYMHCMAYMQPGYCIVDVKRVWIVWPTRDRFTGELAEAYPAPEST
jgi:hypothetical protein